MGSTPSSFDTGDTILSAHTERFNVLPFAGFLLSAYNCHLNNKNAKNAEEPDQSQHISTFTKKRSVNRN